MEEDCRASPGASQTSVSLFNPLNECIIDTANDEAIATVLASEEGADQLQVAVKTAEASKAVSFDHDLALNVHEEEVNSLCRELSDQLTQLPGLLEQQPLERERSQDLSRRLLDAQGVKLVPHVLHHEQLSPKEPPPPEARQRLEARLEMYGLVERRVKGDGNCQFRSLSDQLYRSPHLHSFVRECTVAQLRRGRERYAAYVPGSYDAYCRSMARSGEWGDHITLQAAADYFGLRICVMTSYAEACFIEIEPHTPRSTRTLYLSFWAEVHYNSVYPVSDPPGPLPSEKLFGSRRLYSLLFRPGI